MAIFTNSVRLWIALLASISLQGVLHAIPLPTESQQQHYATKSEILRASNKLVSQHDHEWVKDVNYSVKYIDGSWSVIVRKISGRSPKGVLYLSVCYISIEFSRSGKLVRYESGY